jgi:hypothetical protein
MVSGFPGQRWIMLSLGTFTGLWFLYAGLVVVAIGPITALFVAAGTGMFVIAWTRASGPSIVVLPEVRDGPTTTQSRLVARLLMIN